MKVYRCENEKIFKLFCIDKEVVNREEFDEITKNFIVVFDYVSPIVVSGKEIITYFGKDVEIIPLSISIQMLLKERQNNNESI